MKFVLADANSAQVDEKEVRDMLASTMLMRLGYLDDKGGPVVAPVWFLFENESIWTTVERDSRKDKAFRKDSRVYFTIDSDGPTVRGVRGRGHARVVEDQALTERLVRESVAKYMGPEENETGKFLVQEAVEGKTVAVEISAEKYAVWRYDL